MLEGSIILLVFVAIGIIYIAVKWFQVVGESIEDSAKERRLKKRQKKGHFHFERLNEVEGILSVNGTPMRTYNVGEIRLDGIIDIVFYESYGTEIRITDIYYEGHSLYSFAAGPWREKAEHAVATLKHLSNQRIIKPSIVSEVEEVILEVETLNKHMETGNLVRTEDEDFAWVF